MHFSTYEAAIRRAHCERSIAIRRFFAALFGTRAPRRRDCVEPPREGITVAHPCGHAA
ncbi:MAG: hypothetical protein KDC48_22800 [Planctomycetes bacterium]|nr:hypothetical protein [Planctomycetota bacterium]